MTDETNKEKPIETSTETNKPETAECGVETQTEKVKNERGAGRKKGSKNSTEGQKSILIRKATKDQVKAIEEAQNKIRAQHVLDYLHENITPEINSMKETMKNIYDLSNYKYKKMKIKIIIMKIL